MSQDFPHESESPRYDERDPQILDLPTDVRNWGMLCHLTALLGLAIGGAMFVGPLVVWLLKKNEHPFIDEQGKESLNFHFSMLIYEVVAGMLFCFVIGIPLFMALAVAHIVFVIIASVKVSSGVNYRYPLTIRFLR